MFMLAPELDGPTTRGTFYCGAAALAVAIIGGIAAICISGSVTMMVSAAGVLGLLGIALYGRDMLHLYRARKRRTIELNSRMAGVAFANLAATLVISIGLLVAGNFSQHVGIVVFLVSFGWLSSLALAKLYKIVAFLTWLECYGPVLGKTATPRVQDLVVERRANKWFVLYTAVVWCAAASLALDAPLAFRLSAAVMLLATCGIVRQLLRPGASPTCNRPCACPRAYAHRTCCIAGCNNLEKEMAMTTFVDVDVRPILRAGGEPFGEIMQAIDTLKPGRRPAAAGDVQADAAIPRAGLEGLQL